MRKNTIKNSPKGPKVKKWKDQKGNFFQKLYKNVSTDSRFQKKQEGQSGGNRKMTKVEAMKSQMS